MAQLSQLHIIGIIVTLTVIMIIGINSGKKVKNASDFSTGGQSASTYIVTGAMIGTLIGGASTIGTAELAYTYGLSAWWFSLGLTIGCILFAFIFVKPLRDSGCTTLQQMISNEYGTVSGIVTSVLCVLGIIINIVTQVLAANALLTTMFNITPVQSAILCVLMMICYVVFGGVLGTGVLGIVKLVLIYIAVIFGTFTALKLSGGASTIYNILPHHEYFNLFSRGFGIDIGAALSVALGIISGQTYVQIILSGKSHKVAKNGALIAASLLPPVGIGSIIIGMYMKINYPTINPGQAFPLFIIDNMPPLLGGAILATLLIALVGTGSGMALGFGTIMTNDIYKKFINKNIDSKNELLISRAFIIISFVVSAIFTTGNVHTTILKWGFLASGLRSAVLIVPMCGAIFLKDKIDSRFAVFSSILGVTSLLAAELLLDIKFDPIFISIGVSILVAVFGLFTKRNNKILDTNNNILK